MSWRIAKVGKVGMMVEGDIYARSKPERSADVVVLDGRGAVPDYAVSLGSALAQDGVPVALVSSPDAMCKYRGIHTGPGLKVYPFFALTFRGGLRNGWPLLVGWLRTMSLVLRLRPSLVHVQWLVSPRLESRVLRWLSRLLGFSTVYTVHNVLPHDSDPQVILQWSAVYRRFQHLIVHTQNSRQRLLAMCPELTTDRISVIPHGNYEYLCREPINRADARRALGIGLTTSVIAFVGKLRPYKGITTLLDAFQLCGRRLNAELVIAGRADDRSYLAMVQEHIRLHAIPRVQLMERYLSDGELQAVLSAADTVVLPYVDIDQSGIMLYAMTVGVPIIASRLESFVELLHGEEGALLVPTGDAPALADALVAMLTNPGRREQIGKKGREIALSRYSWRRVAHETEALYKSLGLGR